MQERGSDTSGLRPDELSTFVPRLAYDLTERHGGTEVVCETIDGTLLSADISGFTRLTEQLADRGREGAEVITTAVNSCFRDLIDAGQHYGGDTLKFGGDAILMLFTGVNHELRGANAAAEMQFALRRNTQARRHNLLMTVGVAAGQFHAMLVGSHHRDLLLCGSTTTHTLELEAAAEEGEVVVSRSVLAGLGQVGTRLDGYVTLGSLPFEVPERASADTDLMMPFVPSALRDHWTEYADLGAEHRQAAIGFVGIGGVDDYIAEHSGLATAARVHDLFDAIMTVIEPMGVVLLHSDMAIGGLKLLVGAGVPSAVDKPADSLIHAALQIARIESPFTIKVGANVGSVFGGFLGAPERRTFTVMSDDVNTAARMLGPAEPGDVIAVDVVAARASGHLHGLPIGPFTVKGKTELVSAVRVTGLDRAAEKLDEVDFAGRDAELAALNEALAASTNVTIVGPPGSGKTRLRDEGIVDKDVIDGSAGGYMSATPYGAFWGALRPVLGIAAELDPTSAGRSLVQLLESGHPELVPYAALIATVIGAETSESTIVQAIEPEFRRDILHDVMGRFLGRLRPPPRAIIIEDVQWLDDASSDLISHLEHISDEYGWTVITSRRPGVSADDEGHDATEAGLRIALHPLGQDAIEAIILQVAEGQLLRRELDRLVERAHGNPLFALELARSAGRPEQEIPGSIEEVIANRIDQLPARQRRAVRLASVIGTRFDQRTFSALVEESGYDVEQDCRAMTDVFDVDEDDNVRFRQLLYREVAYASLPFAQRRRLHLTVGEYVESSTQELDPLSALLSYHFAEAGDRRRCWRWSLAAAERAVRQFSPADAVTLYRRAVEHAPRGLDSEERADVHEGLGRALLATASLDEAYAAFGAARRLTAQDRKRLHLMCLQADCRDRQARYSAAMGAYTRVLNDPTTEPSEQAIALLGRASVFHRQGRNRESYDVAHEALRVAAVAQDRLLEGRALKMVNVAGSAIGASDYQQAAVEALKVFSELGQLSEEAEIRNNQGVSHQLRGDLDAAAEAYQLSLSLKRQVGDLSGAAVVQMNLAEVQLDRGITSSVDQLIQECIDVFRYSGFNLGATYSEGLSGRWHMLSGDYPQAAVLLQRAVASMEELGIEAYAANLELVLIEALANLGQLDEATRRLAKNRVRAERDVFDYPDVAANELARLHAMLAQASS